MLLAASACKPAGEAGVIRKMELRTAELDQLDLQAGNPGLPPVRGLVPAVGQEGDHMVDIPHPGGAQDFAP
jgi:hypothetical protein